MAKGKKKVNKKKKASDNQLQKIILIVVFLGVSLVLLPTTIVLVVGMLPTIVSSFVDKTKRKSQTISVGAFNFAAAMLFLLQLWKADQGMNEALNIISDPVAIIVMYMGAGAGYVFDFVVSTIVTNVVFGRMDSRQKKIVKLQKDLKKRWGPEVSGRLALDKDGFPIAQPEE